MADTSRETPEIQVTPIRETFVYADSLGRVRTTIIYKAEFVDDEDDVGAEGWGATAVMAIVALRQHHAQLLAIQAIMEDTV